MKKYHGTIVLTKLEKALIRNEIVDNMQTGVNGVDCNGNQSAIEMEWFDSDISEFTNDETGETSVMAHGLVSHLTEDGRTAKTEYHIEFSDEDGIIAIMVFPAEI